MPVDNDIALPRANAPTVRNNALKSRLGFLLFEVMLAVTVAGIAMAAVLQSISSALAATRLTEDYLFAGTLLSQKMWEVTSRRTIQPGGTEGVFSLYPAYRYKIEAQDIFEENPQPQKSAVAQKRLAKVSVTIAWDYRGKTKQLAAQTYTIVGEEEKSTVATLRI